MQLPNRALLQMLLRGRDVMTGGQIIVNLLAHPASRIDARLGVTKAPFEVRDGAGISGLLTQVGRVGKVDLAVGASYTLLSAFVGMYM